LSHKADLEKCFAFATARYIEFHKVLGNVKRGEYVNNETWQCKCDGILCCINFIIILLYFLLLYLVIFT